RRLDSLVMRAADATRVPAGAALAVDREAFSRAVTDAVTANPLITIVREEVPRVPPAGGAWSPIVIATGPLTSDALSADIQALVGDEHLSFYDAISPIVLAETIDHSRVFRASRWGRSLRGSAEADLSAVARSAKVEASALRTDEAVEPEGDYLNCPFNKSEYDAFYDAL
ncbi:MAG: methylenetetrahydrofolate--tRNA-(uracil(54)-C(5))-methyltransferase (FADH(2)-oxidizing) TrmFO, partial [Luteitalea sp.]|nr:methylenetetrahydrofolate--tRNA-(uracil(54)-C(5))-methyltransferase (FADH(2)-oxidizing) TrmFO [Luteitalea sp.]